MIHGKNSVSLFNNRIAVESFGNGFLSQLHLNFFSLFPKIVKIAKESQVPDVNCSLKGISPDRPVQTCVLKDFAKYSPQYLMVALISTITPLRVPEFRFASNPIINKQCSFDLLFLKNTHKWLVPWAMQFFNVP